MNEQEHEQKLGRRIVVGAGSMLSATLAACTLIGLGWGIHVFYEKLSDKVEPTLAAPAFTQLELTNNALSKTVLDLRSQLDQREKELAELHRAGKEFSDQTAKLHAMYVFAINVIGGIRGAVWDVANISDKTNDAERLKAEITSRLETLTNGLETSFARLTGSGIGIVKERNKHHYFTLVEYPAWGVEWVTGESIKLTD